MDNTKLYEYNEKVKCLKCKAVGAIRFFGTLRNGKISQAVGFGGTIPWQCSSCKQQGLIGNSDTIQPALEGYKYTFKEE